MATTSKKIETIIANINGEQIELTGEKLKTFLTQRELDNAESQKRKEEEQEKFEIKISAYTKLGLTEEEITAIL